MKINPTHRLVIVLLGLGTLPGCGVGLIDGPGGNAGTAGVGGAAGSAGVGGGTGGGTADVRFEVARFVTLSGTYPDLGGPTQVIPLSPGFGIPRAVILFESADRVDGSRTGTGYASVSSSIGYSDGVNNIGCHFHHDPEDPSFGGGLIQDGYVSMQELIGLRVQSVPGMHNGMRATFETDQVTLHYDYLETDEELESFLIAFGGDDISSVDVGWIDDLDTSPNINLGYSPDLFFALTNNRDALQTPNEFNRSGGQWSAARPMTFSHGMAINDGSESQMSFAWHSPNVGDPGSASNTLALYNNTLLASLDEGSIENYTVDLISFGPTGVTLAPSGSTSNAIMGYMAIKFIGNVNMAIVDTTIPTAGDMTVSGVGFRPDLGFGMHLNGTSAYNVAEDGDFSLAFHGFDASLISTAALNGLDGWSSAQDGGGFSREDASFMLQTLRSTPGGGSQFDVEASGYAFNADGVTFTMTNWPSTPVRGRMLLLGVD